MTEATSAPPADAAPAEKSVTTESPKPVTVPPAAPEGHQEHAVVSHPEGAHTKTVDAPHSPVSSKNSLSSSLKADGHGSAGDRDVALSKVHQEKTLSNIRAWEDNSKAQIENRCSAKLAKIAAWENAKKAAAESNLKQQEEKLEKKRAALVEKMRNQIAATHKLAEEKRAAAEAAKGEEIFKVEVKAAEHRAKNSAPSGFLCFKA